MRIVQEHDGRLVELVSAGEKRGPPARPSAPMPVRIVSLAHGDPAEGEAMEWIEELFDISPDGGSGSLEALIVAAVGIVVIGALVGTRSTVRRVRRR